MEGEERHSVGSAPALGTASTLAAESPNVAKAAAARSLFDGRAIPATAATKTTPAAVNVAPPMSHLPSPAKEGSLRGGNLFQSIEQGIHGLVDRSSLHASVERQPLSREGSRHGPGSGSREGSVRRGPRQPQVLLPGDVVEGDSAAQTPEATDDNPCFPPGSTLSLGQADEEEEKEQEEARDGDALFLRQLERLWVSRREDESELAAAASPGPAAASPLPLPLPLPLPPPPSRAALGAPRPVFYDFLRATGSSPAPRWGHAAAALGTDALVVVGGVGAAVFEDVHVFDAIAGSWHEVRTTGPPMQQQRQQQQSQQQQQQRGLQRIPSNGSNRSGSCDSPASSSNLSPSSSSSSLNFAVRAAPLTASSAASAALFARRDAGPGPHFGAAAAEWPAGSGRVFVFGGRQGRGFLRSAHELDVGRGAWRTLRADAVADPWGMAAEGGSLLAAAAAANAASSPSRGGDGGGRKKGGGGGGRSVGSGPPAVAGATLTAVGEHGLLLFGGAGKKVSGEVWLLRPRSVHSTAGEGSAGGSGSGQGGAGGGRRGGGDGASCSSSPSASAALSPLYPPYSSDTWIKLDISPDPTEGSPRPRHGHAAFPGPCGGTDSVVFFGGAASDGGALNDTWLLDLGTRSWRRPRHPAGSCSPPRARFSHCAALMTTAAEAEAEAGTGRSGPGGRGSAALVFGGCTPEGVFLNDAHVLDLRDWSWSPAEAPAGPPPPPPRYGASATAVGGRLLLYGGSDARQPFGGVVSVVTDFGSDLNAVAGDMLVSSHHSASSPAAAAAASTAQRRLSATAVPAGAETGADDDAPSSPSLSSAPLSPSFATPVAAPTPPPLPSSSSFSPPPPIATGCSMRSRLADALGRRSAQATAAAAARKAAVAEGLFRAERERADALAADLAAARLLLGEERASLEGEARRAALVVSASARREAESARRAAAAAAGAQREAELRAEEAERRAEEAEARAAEAEEREQRSVSAGEDREASLAASLRARLRAAEAGRASAAREAVAARATAEAARQGAARARAEAVAEATARQGSASLELLVREVSRLQAHARALEAALEGAGEAALAARASSGGAGAGVGAGAGGAAGAASPPPPSAAAVTALELQLSRYRGEPATLASLSPEELRSLEDELVKSARAAAEAAREADAASAAALRAALADREARLRSLARCLPSAAAGASAALARSSSSTAECGICLEREVEVSLDCGHLLCSGCAEEQRARKGRCPFCDAPVTGTRRVFVG